MIWKRQIAIFGIAFALVLVGGIALAAVGAIGPTGDNVGGAKQELAAEPNEEPEPTTTTVAQEPGDDRSEEGSGEGDHGEQPKEEPKDEPGEEASEPPKEEPTDEPTEPKEEVDSTPPDFGITSPENGATTDDEVITFKGFVEPGSTVTRSKWTANQEGEHWSMALVLSPGKNVVGFLATDAAGNVSDASVTVYYVAPEKKEPKEEPKEEPDAVAWSAKQTYGSCAENPPYDIFYGTATPGTKIWVESKYGGASTTANGDGQWSVKATFYEVPAGKSFEVVVESSNGNRKVFPFTYTGGGEEGGGGKEG